MMYGMASGPRYGTTIRRARLRKRWRQQQLADAVGVSLRTVGDWENNRSFPRNPVAVEDALGISLGEEAAGPPPLTDAERRELMEDYERIGKLLGMEGSPGRDAGATGGNVHDAEGRSA